MNSSEIYSILLNNFSLKPTLNQIEWFRSISNFLDSNDNEKIFLLKGYAGTGKSTLISHLVNHLDRFNYNSVLIAPTGRAAKVISSYSKK